ncbi:MAG: 2-amino-4-hydroxy-6-hydroxymethyldihydropteridine diphosphokinase [Planctomycetes bacterium]|nr:2-amino-4-hydroxy-6-hydroxymethyldihydropteridine diphosphokinase [Planctomycetota bacterium]
MLQTPHTVYIALGSNLGERELNLRRALAALGGRQGVEVRKVSSFIETAPLGGPPQGKFINAAAELGATLGPRPLLDALLAVEDEMGRQRTERWGPRVIDLDLLLYEDRIINRPGLQVPHPRMHRRRFVLEPLCEIAPRAVHPVRGASVADLLAELAPRAK